MPHNSNPMKDEPLQTQSQNPYSLLVAQVRDACGAFRAAESPIEFELAILQLKQIAAALEWMEIKWEP